MIKKYFVVTIYLLAKEPEPSQVPAPHLKKNEDLSEKKVYYSC